MMQGHEAIHASDLVDGNRSTDVQVAAAADAQGRVVVTKDRDFRDWHWLRGTPGQLLIVATGNISNEQLLRLFGERLDALVTSFEAADFVELTPDALVVHPKVK